MNHETAVADAAAKLREAIEAAQSAGYRVDFPTYALGNIGVSETKRVVPAENLTPAVPVIAQRRLAPSPPAADPA